MENRSRIKMPSSHKRVVVRKGGKVYEYCYPKAPKLYPSRAVTRRLNLTAHLEAALESARRRAVKAGLPFSLTFPDLIRLIEAQHFECALTGIPFDMTECGQRGEAFRKPLRPSIDRLEAAHGYVLENIRIICTAANVALNEWGEDIFYLMASGYLAKKHRQQAAA